jgi:hypothetical protein
MAPSLLFKKISSLGKCYGSRCEGRVGYHPRFIRLVELLCS